MGTNSEITEHSIAGRVTGLILVGGRSSRFGADKASALLLGEPLLQWVVRALEPVCAEIVVVAAVGQAVPTVQSSVRTTVIYDEVAFEGPLAGLLAGLRQARTEWAFLASCDAPLLRTALVTVLFGYTEAAAVSVCPRVAGRLQPLSALYRTSSLPELQRLFDQGERRPSAISERLQAVVVEESALLVGDPDLRSFHNANTPAELTAIAELAGGAHPD